MPSEVVGLRSHEDILHEILKLRPEQKLASDHEMKKEAGGIKNLLTIHSGLIDRLKHIEIEIRNTQPITRKLK